MINIGGYVARQGQIFWQGKTCVAFFPELQVLDGHLIITNLSEAYQYSKWTAEEVTEAIRMKFTINRAIIEHLKAHATTLYVQVVDQQVWKKTIVHIIPRYKGDLPDNDQIYKMLETYPRRLLTQNLQNQLEASSFQQVCKQSFQFSKLISKYV